MSAASTSGTASDRRASRNVPGVKNEAGRIGETGEGFAMIPKSMKLSNTDGECLKCSRYFSCPSEERARGMRCKDFERFRKEDKLCGKKSSKTF